MAVKHRLSNLHSGHRSKAHAIYIIYLYSYSYKTTGKQHSLLRVIVLNETGSKLERKLPQAMALLTYPLRELVNIERKPSTTFDAYNREANSLVTRHESRAFE